MRPASLLPSAELMLQLLLQFRGDPNLPKPCLNEKNETKKDRRLTPIMAEWDNGTRRLPAACV